MSRFLDETDVAVIMEAVSLFMPNGRALATDDVLERWVAQRRF
jgi:hypothetical protein